MHDNHYNGDPYAWRPADGAMIVELKRAGFEDAASRIKSVGVPLVQRNFQAELTMPELAAAFQGLGHGQLKGQKFKNGKLELKY